MGDRKADGQRVDGCGDALHEERSLADLFTLPFFTLDSLNQHLSADKGKQTKRDIRNQF
jgi:hypothetical protein